jgi:hypothetical protein
LDRIVHGEAVTAVENIQDKANATAVINRRPQNANRIRLSNRGRVPGKRTVLLTLTDDRGQDDALRGHERQDRGSLARTRISR